MTFEKLKLEELHRISKEQYKNKIKSNIILVLDDVRSMYNVGTVFRAADCLGVMQIYLCGITPVPPHREISKTAIGAEESVPWKYEKEIKNAISELKKNDYKIIAVEQTRQSTLLHQYNTNNEKIALVFGNEVEGVSKNALALCNECIEIPQFGSKHSFNISPSVGIVLWHLYCKNVYL